MQRLTIYEISRLAGVSITTVSRVLNGSNKVNPETKQRVQDVIQKYGYIPKQTARNFAKRDIFGVGLLMDDIRHSYMSELAYAISQELDVWKVEPILCNMPDVEREFIMQVDNLVDKRIHGIILLGSVFENEICRIAIERRYSELPFVAVNANLALPNVYEVLQDQVQGTRDAVQYLYECGKRKIGWIYYHKSHSDKKKHQGFLEGMKKYDLFPERMCETESKSLSEGMRATEALLKEYPDTDAIIFSSDSLAVGGVHYLNHHGIAIPNPISVVGFNNSTSAKECYPTITSIDNRAEDAGKAAAQMMLRILNKQEVENITLACGLQIRESTPKK